MRHLIALAAVLAATSPALASGSTMPLPMQEETLESYAGCLANLNAVHALDVRRLDLPPETRENGSVLKRSISTEGVVETGPEAALYKAEYGTTVSVTDAEARQIKHQYSWERVEMTCTGPKLAGTSQQGYSSASFEPLPE